MRNKEQRIGMSVSHSKSPRAKQQQKRLRTVSRPGKDFYTIKKGK